MAFKPWTPEAGNYIRYWSQKKQAVLYRQLLWKRSPLIFPYRFASLAAGAQQSSATSIKDINPSDDYDHIFLGYVGVCPLCNITVWHPSNVKLLKWDDRITLVDEDELSVVTYEMSPIEYPTYQIAVDHDRYPAFQPRNLSGEAKCPEIMIIGSMYKVVEDEALPSDVKEALVSGKLRSYPWDFGGEML
jgi:hypothetical protein